MSPFQTGTHRHVVDHTATSVEPVDIEKVSARCSASMHDTSVKPRCRRRSEDKHDERCPGFADAHQ